MIVWFMLCLLCILCGFWYDVLFDVVSGDFGGEYLLEFG